MFISSTLKLLDQKQQGLKRNHEYVEANLVDPSEKRKHKHRIERRQMKQMAVERKKCEIQRKDGVYGCESIGVWSA